MTGKDKTERSGCPEAGAAEEQARRCFESMLESCRKDEDKFARFEQGLFARLFELGRLLVVVYFVSRHRRLTYRYSERVYRVGDNYAERTLHTVFGEVCCGRLYLKRRKGGSGYHPLDVALGLTRDGYSPVALSLVARLATRMSYESVRAVMRAAWGWAPSTETLQALVTGLGRYAADYVEAGCWWKRRKGRRRDGAILVIEADGKCPPTATEAELAKRRGRRRRRRRCCQRHRGRQGRTERGPRPRRRKGEKSKNGREAVVVVMYTLRRGADGLLHGPINKKVWASFAGRPAAAAWARAEATRRGFPSKRNREVQVLVDGAGGLEQRLRPLFRGAIFTLDVRHVEERLWKAGRAFHREGSKELTAWVEQRRELLYEHQPRALAAWLEAEQQRLAGRRGTQGKRQALEKFLAYLRPRLKMLNYALLKRKDLVLATGQVEGAVRHLVGQRLDCAGMRWIVANAERLLQLRCLEVNGDWDDFFAWVTRQNQKKLRRGEPVKIRTKTPTPVGDAP